MDKAKQCRKEIEDKIINYMNIVDSKNKQNVNKFKNRFASMDDDKFFEYIESVIYDRYGHFYFEIEMGKNEITLEKFKKAADFVNVKLFDKIGFRDIVDGQTIYTTQDVFIGLIPIRKVQQYLNKKNHIPTDMKKINPKTHQVTGKSKGGRISDMELFGLIVQDMPNLIKEFFGPRAGDPVMAQQMFHDVATTGTTYLSDMVDSKENKVALNTANMFLLGAGLESDMVTTPGYILPRTFAQRNIKGLTRRGD